MTKNVQDYLWRGLNAYNFAPLLERNVPKHARYAHDDDAVIIRCDKCVECGILFYAGIDGTLVRRGSGGKSCPTCAG